MERLFLSLIVSLCLLLGCASRRDQSMNSVLPSVDRDSAQQIENNQPTDDGLNIDISELEGKVNMTALPESAGNLDVTITNNSDVDIKMGEDFSLKKMDGETWKDISLSLFYADHLIVIAPGESHTFHYDIGYSVVLESNTVYQIEKVVSAGQKDYSVSVSFEIQ